MVLGEPSVTISGITMMPVWYADNLDTLHMVMSVPQLSILWQCPQLECS